MFAELLGVVAANMDVAVELSALYQFVLTNPASEFLIWTKLLAVPELALL